MDLSDLDRFFDAYIECALWSSYDQSRDDGGDPLDQYDGEFHPYVLESMETECAGFIRANLADLTDLDAEQCGHDFWLTRNGHGAGFWDRDLDEVGERLTEACGWGTKFPEVDLYIGDDGLIYASGHEPKPDKSNPLGI